MAAVMEALLEVPYEQWRLSLKEEEPMAAAMEVLQEAVKQCC